MPLAANIVIADGQATPVNHTLVPTGRDGSGVLRYVEQTAGPIIGAWRAGFSITKPTTPKPGQSTQGRIERIKLNVQIPVLETLSNNSAGYVPAPMVAYSDETVVTLNIPERSTEAQRKTVRLAAIALLQSAEGIALIEKGILAQ